MKKRFVTILVSSLAAICLLFGFTACDAFIEAGTTTGGGTNTEQGETGTTTGGGTNTEQGETCTHPAETTWSFDETHHWHSSACSCNVKVDFAEHTIDDSGWCTVCEQAILPTDGVYYDISADGTYAEVITYTGTATRVKIADTYEGLPVISIYRNAFENTKIVSVIIPDSVTSIADGAFSGCSSLEEITIPFVGAEAGKTANDTYQYPFGYIFGTSSYTDGTATTQYYYGSSTFSKTYTTYYIPSSLKKVTVAGGDIFYGAFYGCSSLTSVTLPDSVTSIDDSAFYKCSKLTSVTIGNSVTSIGDCAFKYCSSLTSITIPDSVTSIGGSAFSGCSSLTSITIPDSVTSIGDYAFYNCSNLQYNTFGNLNYLGNDRTPYLIVVSPVSTNFIKYEISSTAKIILRNAFQGCTRFTNITIPGNVVTSIGGSAFSGCSSLTSVTIGNGVTSIGDSAFYGCGLTSVYYDGTVEEWEKISIGSYNFQLTSATRYYYSETEPTTTGNYWHYDENGNVAVW